MFPTEPTIAILEDDLRRRAAMSELLVKKLPGVKVFFFEAAGEMIDWFPQHQEEVSLISLDHDLPVRRDEAGELIDFGSGEMVANLLATLTPTCPVILHTSNADGAWKMKRVLGDAGWPTARVYPADDLKWIKDFWMVQVLSYDSVTGFYDRPR